jgi:hypothetical protein
MPGRKPRRFSPIAANKSPSSTAFATGRSHMRVRSWQPDESWPPASDPCFQNVCFLLSQFLFLYWLISECQHFSF